MECPICLNKKSSKFLVELECHHKLCHSCATHWLLKTPTCPYCRRKSLYFCKDTRSRSQANVLVQEASHLWKYIRRTYGNTIPSDIFFEFIRYFFLQENNRWIWYRPHLVRFKKQFKNICRVHPRKETLSPLNQRILSEFLQSSP